jgi:hypothetical protein
MTSEANNGITGWYVVHYDTPTRKAREREFDAGQGADARRFAARMGGTLRAVHLVPGTLQAVETEIAL